MPKRSITRELRRKLKDFSDTLRHVQLIAIDNNSKHIEIADVDIKEMKVNIKDLDAPGTSRFWVDDQNYLRSLTPITKKPEPKPKKSQPPQPPRTKPPPTIDAPSYIELRPKTPEPPKPQTEGGIWCYYCKTHRVPNLDGKCIECRSQLVYDWIKP